MEIVFISKTVPDSTLALPHNISRHPTVRGLQCGHTIEWCLLVLYHYSN